MSSPGFSDIQLIEIRHLLRFEVNPLMLRFWMPLKGVKEGVESPMSSLSDKLDTVCDKLDELEGCQKTLEGDLCASSSSPRTHVPGKHMPKSTSHAGSLNDVFNTACELHFHPPEQN